MLNKNFIILVCLVTSFGLYSQPDYKLIEVYDSLKMMKKEGKRLKNYKDFLVDEEGDKLRTVSEDYQPKCFVLKKIELDSGKMAYIYKFTTTYLDSENNKWEFTEICLLFKKNKVVLTHTTIATLTRVNGVVGIYEMGKLYEPLKTVSKKIYPEESKLLTIYTYNFIYYQLTRTVEYE